MTARATGTRPVPRAPGNFLLGNAAPMIAAPHWYAAATAREHGGIVGLRVLNRRLIAISHADYVRNVLVTNAAKYRRSFHYENPVLGNGLLSSDGPSWLARRRQVNAAFRRDTLERLVPVAREETDRVIERWSATASRGESVGLVHEMQRLTISIIGRSLLSTALSEADAVRFANAVRDAARFTRRRNTALVIPPLWVPTSANRGLLRMRDLLDNFLMPIIAERRRQPVGRRDLLDALIAVRDPDTGEALDDQAVLNEAKTLFAAGFETTATALSWTLHLLARHPEVAARWYDEVDREVGDRPVEFADLERMPYLDRIISESLRLYPPVYNIGRVCVERDQINGYDIPAGTVLLLSILGVHHDPQFWPDPLRFDPDRFAGEWSRHAFIPFATGQHVCIGNNFALTEMAVSLVGIAQRFRIEPVDAAPVDAIANVTLLPAREIPIRPVARQ